MRRAITPQTAVTSVLLRVIAGQLGQVEANRLFEHMWHVLEREGLR